MSQKKTYRTIWNKLFSGGGWALFTMFVWELVEEGLESLIAYALSSAIAIFATKVLSTLAIITATQGIKVTIKRFLTPFIKEITFKEGSDKMTKLKQIWSWIYANKCTIGGVAVGALTVVSGAGLVDVNSFAPLYIGAVNITPIIYYGILGVMTILVSFFPETVEKWKVRIEAKKAEKEQKAIEKEAKKEIKAELKTANQTQAEQEKAQLKAEAEKKAQAEKEKTEQEYRAKVEQAKAKIIAESKNNASNN